MITFSHVSKQYGDKLAVNNLTVTIQPGHVTGLLGPNGAGKSTVMRLLLGLDRPTAGDVLIDGVPYGKLRHPLRMVGAHLDGRAVHPGRTARSHLLGLARYNGIPARRVDDVLELVGLSAVAGKKVGGFSLGMGQRLGIAGALLGDPQILILDEPVNGLDTDGVRWIRTLLQRFAAEGRTILVSSHLMTEVHQTVDRVVVLGQGRLLADCPISELTAEANHRVLVRMPEDSATSAFALRLRSAGLVSEAGAPGELIVSQATVEEVGDLAFTHGLRLHTLSAIPATLEESYLRLVHDDIEYSTSSKRGTRS